MSGRAPRFEGRADVLITGGGTAGHVLPALAIAEALVRLGHARERIHFVGSRRGMEKGLVPEAGFTVTLLPGRGIVRRPSLRNLWSLFCLGGAFFRSLVEVRKRRPQVIVGVGGYASVPCALAGICLRVPLVIVNVDAVPGAANRLLGRFARQIAVASATALFPQAVVTGVPVRAAVTTADRSVEGRAKARASFSLEETRTVIVVTGGSLGARRLNEAGVGLARIMADRADLVIYQVAGERDYPELAKGNPALTTGAAKLDYRLVPYEKRLPELLVAADLLVCRAGASTLAELAVIGVASVLVPLPGAPADHQTKNAAALANAGAAILVPDEQATPEHLADLLSALVSDPTRRRDMAQKARALSKPAAAASIASLIEDVGSLTRSPDGVAQGGMTR